jgi:glycosyltransferase involved in cell wall biosynthesis
VIPTYNRPALLREAIRSALEQTYARLEIVVSENAGPEVSDDVCRSFADSRIRFRRNAVNLGIAGNIREATKAATGDFVAHLHDDDLLEPTFVEQLLTGFAAAPDVALCFGDHRVIRPDCTFDENAATAIRARFGRDRLAAGVHRCLLRLALLEQSIPPTCLIRKAAIDWDELPTEAGSAYDWYLWYLLARGGAAAWYLPTPVYRYRLHAGQETAARLRMGEGATFCWRAFLADPLVAPIQTELTLRAAAGLTAHGLALVRSGRLVEGRTALQDAIARGAGFRARLGLVFSYAPALLRLRDRIVAAFRRPAQG